MNLSHLTNCYWICAGKIYDSFNFEYQLKIDMNCCNNNIDILKLILSNKNINVNAINNMNFTALDYASVHGYIQCAMLLLKNKNINPNISHEDYLSKEKVTSLYLASKKGCKEIVEFILNSSNFQKENKEGFFILFKFYF